jgi:hypothetical protein
VIRQLPSEAYEALEAVRQERAASGAKPLAPVFLCVDDAPEAPRPIEWSVIYDGVIVRSSQAHRVGRRRSA